MIEHVLEATFDAPEGETSKKKKKPKKASRKDRSPSKKTIEAEPKVTKYFDKN